jgi:hypothetical protein
MVAPLEELAGPGAFAGGRASTFADALGSATEQAEKKVEKSKKKTSEERDETRVLSGLRKPDKIFICGW